MSTGEGLRVVALDVVRPQPRGERAQRVERRGRHLRERGYLASRGFVAFHVDYRNHAESTDDLAYQQRMRLGSWITACAAGSNGLLIGCQRPSLSRNWTLTRPTKRLTVVHAEELPEALR